MPIVTRLGVPKSRLVGFISAMFFALPAAGQSLQPSGEFKAVTGKLIRSYCHMDVCSWISIEQATLVGRSSKGELYVVGEKSWSSVHKGGNYGRPAPRTDERVSVSFYLCSKSAPALINWYSDDGSDKGPKAWHLSPLKPGRSDTVFGFNTSAYVDYMAVCHANADVDKATDEQFGQRLGYHFSDGSLADAKIIASPFDALQ